MKLLTGNETIKQVILSDHRIPLSTSDPYNRERYSPRTSESETLPYSMYRHTQKAEIIVDFMQLHPSKKIEIIVI